MLPRTSSIWQRDSHPTASGKPGAVHISFAAKPSSTQTSSLGGFDRRRCPVPRITREAARATTGITFGLAAFSVLKRSSSPAMTGVDTPIAATALPMNSWLVEDGHAFLACSLLHELLTIIWAQLAEPSGLLVSIKLRIISTFSRVG